MKAFCLYGLVLAMSVVSANVLPADEPRPATPPGGPTEGSRRNDKHLDHQFAACLILQNQNEIAVAKIAEERSKSPEVKKFAQMLQKDHQAFLGELAKVGGAKFQNRRPGSLRPDAAAKKPADRREAAPANAARPRDADETVAAGDHDLQLEIKREIADECATSAEQELNSKEGREFDACFIGMQLAAHQNMVNELKVLERYASSELQGTLKKGRETAQSHLDQAKEIMKDIDRRETRTTAK